MTSSQQSLSENLRQVGLRATPARLAVMRLLRRSAKPLDAQAIWQRLGAAAPDPVTVYRILASLAAAGLVRQIQLTAGVSSYESTHLPHHHHLTCERCGYIEDVVAACETTPVVDSFQVVTHHTIEFSGICKKCAA